ncbi:hypothetical protein EVAR_16316_1 [Eumeta japonica]|uniref:Uncharacterized protein n=1 Tax=Eumeta variegata TaxID=151549 RepID=A0A4C1VG39_EUMVA|nr:hypothetical protein EVAR_16316_1 [Eumeta japonica]
MTAYRLYRLLIDGIDGLRKYMNQGRRLCKNYGTVIINPIASRHDYRKRLLRSATSATSHYHIELCAYYSTDAIGHLSQQRVPSTRYEILEGHSCTMRRSPLLSPTCSESGGHIAALFKDSLA